MSKRLKNYTDPMVIVSKYGADAVRLYLINSPVVRGDNLCFKDEGVKEVVKDVFLPWLNAYKFLIQNVENFERVRLIYLSDNYNTSNIIIVCLLLLQDDNGHSFLKNNRL